MTLAHAVGYVRVSTDRQAEHGFGVETQRATLAAWAANNECHLVEIYVDEGVSGTTDAIDRPGLAEAMQMIAEGRASTLVVARLDRLARSLSVQEACLAQLWVWGATVWACDIGEVRRDDPSDPMRTALRQMVAVFSQLERAMIVARMREGRATKAQDGGYAYGAPPYGYRAEAGALVRHPVEQQTIERMMDLRAAGQSLREIGQILDHEGRPPRRSARWHPNAIRRIVERETPA